jgi:hypothetical protein
LRRFANQGNGLLDILNTGKFNDHPSPVSAARRLNEGLGNTEGIHPPLDNVTHALQRIGTLLRRNVFHLRLIDELRSAEEIESQL